MAINKRNRKINNCTELATSICLLFILNNGLFSIFYIDYKVIFVVVFSL